MRFLWWILTGLVVAGAALTTVLLIARRLRRSDDGEAMRRDMERRLERNSRDVEALQALADLSWRAGAWHDAGERYGRLLDLVGMEPGVDETTATVRRGAAAWRQGRLEDAYRDLVVAHVKDKTSLEAAYYLGCVEEARGEHEKAAACLQAACELDPGHSDAARMLGLCLARAKRFRDALPHLQRAVDLLPEDSQARFALGQALHATERPAEAVACLARLHADPQFGPAAALFTGTIRLNGRDFERAVADLEAGLRHGSAKRETRLELQYRLGAALLAMNEVNRAVTVWKELEALEPGFRDVVALLARYRELSGNRKLQVYLMAPTTQFVALCRRLAVAVYRPATVKLASISFRQAEYVDIMAVVTTRTWTDEVLMRFVRTTGVIGELLLRDLHAKAKENKAGRCYCVCPGTFSDTARKFVEARMMEIADGQGLAKLLDKVPDGS
jgi:tetratricopeptide (TPR) repeat protein